MNSKINILHHKNSMICKENGELLSIGTGLIPYINKENPELMGFSSNGLNRNDLVIFIEIEPVLAKKRYTDILRTLGIEEDINRQCPLLAIGMYQNKEIQPIFKNNQIELQLDTIFNGHEIKVQARSKENYIAVKLNGKTLFMPKTQGSSQLIIVDDAGIKYFGDQENGCSFQEIENIFLGKQYDAFLKIEALKEKNLFIQSILAPQIVKIMEYFMQCENVAYGKYENRYIAIEKNEIQLELGNVYVYTIENDETQLEKVNKYIEQLSQIENMSKKDKITEEFSTSYQILGIDKSMDKIKFYLKKAAITNTTILLTGESGTGKTFLAKEIHKGSKRKNGPYVHVNCAAIPYHLIESELFGHVEGAFTGARKGGKIGYFELAQGGSIFLDEITELPLELQGRLLEVIQNKTFYKVGGSHKIEIDSRLIVATNRNIKELVLEKKFREDLYYRIHVFPIEVPPLRERCLDFHMITTTLLPRICEKIEVEPLILSSKALDKIKKYHWPGNIRELENVLEKSAILCDGNVILPEHIDIPTVVDHPIGLDRLKQRVEQSETEMIVEALNLHQGEKTKTAEYLGIGRTTLFEKMKKYKIEKGN